MSNNELDAALSVFDDTEDGNWDFQCPFCDGYLVDGTFDAELGFKNEEFYKVTADCPQCGKSLRVSRSHQTVWEAQ